MRYKFNVLYLFSPEVVVGVGALAGAVEGAGVVAGVGAGAVSDAEEA